MRRHSVLAGAGAAGATLVLLMSGCSSNTTEAEGEQSAQDQESTSQAASSHNDVDATFARDMIPHHEQAIVMSDIVLAKDGIDPRVSELAEQIKAAQNPEIETMRGWLAQWGTDSAPSGHEGHDMSGEMSGDMSAHEEMGMMTEQQLEQLRQAQGAEASRLFLDGMIAHHEGAVRMAQTEIDGGQSEAARQLANDIVDTQQREIVVMKQILGTL